MPRRMPPHLRAQFTNDESDVHAAGQRDQVNWYARNRMGSKNLPPHVGLGKTGIYVNRAAFDLIEGPAEGARIGVLDGAVVLEPISPEADPQAYKFTISVDGTGNRKIGAPNVMAFIAEQGIPVPSKATPTWNDEQGWLECRPREGD